MSTRVEQLARKRQALLLRCAVQRQQLAQFKQQVESRLLRADRAIAIVSIAARRPGIVFIIVAAVIIAGPGRLLRWLDRGAMLIRVMRSVQQVVAK